MDAQAFTPTVRWRDDPLEYKRQYNRFYKAGGRRPHPPRRPAIIRMLAFIDMDPPVDRDVPRHLGTCWLWTGARNADGYGIIRGDRDPETGRFPLVLAHRLSLVAALGRPLGEGMVACHRCHIRRCVRPRHLYEGTLSDNNRDVWEVRRAKGLEARSL